MSKFPNPAAEWLYQQTADDQVGSSSEGLGWAGLYLKPSDTAHFIGIHAVILFEATDGSVDMFTYDTEDEMREAWLTFERSLDVAHPNVHEEIIIWVLGEGEGCLWTIPNPDHPATGFPPLIAGYAPDLLNACVLLRTLYEPHDEPEFWRYENGRFYLTDLYAQE